MPDESDAWGRALDGDGRAFASLFRLHRDRVFRAAYRLVDGRDDAEDVTAAAFLELWRRRDRVVLVDGSLLPWLLVTAHNLSRNVNRGLRRYRSMLDALARTSDARDPVLTVEGRQTIAVLATALRKMRESDAALIWLVSVECLAASDAATLLGLRPSSARTRLYRARQRLRAELGDAAPERPYVGLRIDGSDA